MFTKFIKEWFCKSKPHKCSYSTFAFQRKIIINATPPYIPPSQEGGREQKYFFSPNKVWGSEIFLEKLVIEKDFKRLVRGSAMWIFPTRKQIKKELKKISRAFKSRDGEIQKNKGEIETTKQKIARLEGVVAVLLKSQSLQVSKSLNKSQSNIETKIINRVRRSKKSLVMAEISKLMNEHSVIEIYEVIVLEKGLCSKASFYRYIQSLKSQKLLRLRQK